MIFNSEITNDIFIRRQFRIFVDFKNLKISELITSPITVGSNTSLLKTREILLKNKVKRVVIVEKKIPIGIITEKDIAKKIYELGTAPIKDVKAKNFIQKRLYTLTRDNSVKECAKMMKKHRISLVIILNSDKTLEGIVTETDLVRVFITKKVQTNKVSKLMQTKLITAEPSDPVLLVENLLLKYGISRVIIKGNHKPVGIITFRDFVPAKIPQWIADSADPKEVQDYKFKKGLEESHANQMSYLFPFHATDIMSSNPITIEANDDVRKAVTLMMKNNISGLPVVKNSKLVGIITKSDIVRSLAE